MGEKELQLTDYLHVIRRRKWILITFFAVTVGLVSLGSLRQTPIYRANASILIEKESPQTIKTQEVVTLGEEGDYVKYYNTQIKILQSRYIAEKALARMGGPEIIFPELVKKKEALTTPPVKAPVADFQATDSQTADSPAVEKPATIDSSEYANRLVSLLTVELVRDSRLVKLSADHPDPTLSALIANTVARVFVEENLSRKLRATGEAQVWLLQQSQDAEGRLQASENVLENYRRSTGMVSLEQSQDIVVERLKELSTAYTVAQNERIQALSAYNQLKNLPRDDLNALESLSAVVNNTLIQDLKRDYINLESQYQKLLDKYTPKHPEMVRLSAQINSLKGKIFSEIDKIAQKYRMDYEASLEKEKELKEQLTQQEKGALGLSGKAVNYNILKRTADTNRELYQMLLTRAKETGLTEEIKGNNISVLDQAQIPIKPIRPRTGLNILLAVMVGLVGGSGLAFFAEYMDKSIKTISEIKEELQIPLLGTVPNIKLRDNIQRDTVVLQKHIHHGGTESFRMLRTNLLLTSPDKPLKSILITSSGAGEGKTLVASNLGIIFSQTGSRVLIIDADFRKPQMHKIFNLYGKKGLSEHLVSDASLEEVIQTTQVENLFLVTCGKIPPNPAELLSSKKMLEFSRLIRDRFDYILYDSPPISSVADAIILSASVVDGTVLVVRAG
ncbi:MAG: polysaccharide biosynthesis tyrosine autokinase, partial [Candidatus Omnitrophica bacterium]|nr:polysaccharide biosynthesis tyrosine autokinase [Candidatus Omnitrophota bacterium]